jgi:Flp pilus assembly protein TadD
MWVLSAKTRKIQRISRGILGLVCGVLFASAALGQAPVAEANFDPSDVYFQGYLATRAAEQLEEAGDFIGARERLGKASELFSAVRKFYPNWKPEMVAGRSDKTVEAINRVNALADNQMRENRIQVAELEGGMRQAGEEIDPAEQALPQTPGILEVDPLAARRLEEAEAELQRLQNLPGGNAAAGGAGSTRERLQAAENTVRSLRAKLAAAPMQKDMLQLGKRIESLEQEREAMALALSQSREAHSQAMAKIGTLETELNTIRQQYADLDRNLKVERKVSNSVVAGQRRQLEALEKELQTKNTELAQANERISGLMNELRESREAFAELRTERDSLLQERDQMAALLKLNEAGRIQDLIEQNMALARNLREANEKVDRLNRESNADKDAYTDALRDLAIAKSQINRLHQEKREQDKRLIDLESRLRSEEQALARGETAVDPVEAEVLRDIIKRQLRVQERRRQARDLMVEAAKQLGTKDERLAKAIELFDAQEIALSPEEQRLVENRQVDGEFVSPFARDRATVSRAMVDLNRDIKVFERTAEKSFLNGRMLPTRELFQMILDQNPGHTPTLCKIGVVHLKLDEPAAAADSFRRAVELDPHNPYAHRMLGFSYMRLSEVPAAEQALRQAILLAPNDANAHMLLGTLLYRVGRPGEAEVSFKAAISADPLPSEPYYNLALICARDRRFEDAKNYYEQALERGAIPDPALEELLGKH